MLGALGALLPLVIPMFHPWTALNCVETDVNIATGHVRKARSLWYLKISERTEETALSKSLKKDPKNHPSAWRRVTITSVGSAHSRHTAYHAAHHQIRMYEQLCEQQNLPKREREALAISLAKSWQETEGDAAADNLLRTAWNQKR